MKNGILGLDLWFPGEWGKRIVVLRGMVNTYLDCREDWEGLDSTAVFGLASRCWIGDVLVKVDLGVVSMYD
jgi:hypothetical protein